MKELDYLVFGAQYYRAPTPLREDFDSDLKAFAEQGFNTIKIWLQWRWNNPAEGVYDFSDMKELMDIAYKYGLKVVINIICDVCPAWFFKKYPDSVMRFSDGTPLMPQTTAYRQIGGAPGPCYHHPEGRAVRKEFIEEATRQLGSHPALLCWDLWNEPELTCGIKREPKVDDMVCYCDNSRREFIEYLKEKYGDINGVNSAWGRNYNDFDELELPICPQTFQDMIDWRMFFAHTLTMELRMRAEAVRGVNDTRPVMVHTVPMPYFNMVNACSDEYMMAKEVDWFGNSLGSFPFTATTSTSAAKGKIVFNSEIQAIVGDTMNHPRPFSFDEIKQHILVPLGRGCKGFLFWQYKPERTGRESPAWGLTDYMCNVTPQLKYAQIINNGLQKYSKMLLKSEPLKAKIAVLNSSEDQLFHWCVTYDVERYYLSVKGFFDMLYEKNYPVDIISEHQLTEDCLYDYDCIIAPLPYYMRKDQADALRKWVEKGGFLISEAYFGAYTAERNLHSKITPGYGFDKVFGVHEDVSYSMSTFTHSYNKEWSKMNAQNEMPIFYDGGIAKGFFIRESFVCDTGEEFARFEDGTAAAVNSYGKGHAAIIGSLIGRTYAVSRDEATAGLIYSLLEKYTDQRPVAKGGRHVDFLKVDGKPSFMVVQAEPDQTDVCIESELLDNACKLRGMMDDREYEVKNGKVTVTLTPGGIDSFAVEQA